MNDIDLIAPCYDDYPRLYACLRKDTLAEAVEAELLTLMEKTPMTPTKTHLHFTGRDQALKTVQKQLKSQPLVAIIGLGGMGKTTLALEVIERLRAEKRYRAEVWTSAKYSQFSGEGITSDSPTATAESLPALFSEIITQAIPTAHTKPPADHPAIVQAWLAEQPTLIVLDNFETIAEPDATLMLQGLHRILGQGRVLITSRHRLSYEAVSQIELVGLPELDSLAFLQNEAHQRHTKAVTQASSVELKTIYQACGGQPLAMRLVVGQLSRLPLRRVLRYLAQPRPEQGSFELYRFIYQFSWDMLDIYSQHLLVALGGQTNNIPLFMDDLEDMTAEIIPTDAFDASLDRLVQLSLIEKKDVGLDKQYQLHPLTYQFIKSAITKEW